MYFTLLPALTFLHQPDEFSYDNIEKTISPAKFEIFKTCRNTIFNEMRTELKIVAAELDDVISPPEFE